MHTTYMQEHDGQSPEQVVLYERYDSWDDGINVGCADGHVQFITDEASFRSQLE